MAWIPLAAGVAIAAGAYSAKAISRRLAMTPAEKVAAVGAKNVFGKIHYPGNFKEKMDINEAALIMGVRATADKKKIEDRYRKVMMLNHPDQGGSPYLAGKVNEARTLLMKGKE